MDRREGNSDPNCKVGLVLEGGSLRGVFSCGAAHALNKHGLANSFDVIIGTSSGALNGLYFPGNDEILASTIYEENATDPRCLNIWNFPEVLDVRWMITEWILDKKRFSDQAVYDGHHEIFISTTDTESGETRWFSSKKDSRKNFEKSICATAYTPIVCSQLENIDGRHYNDGYVNAALPIKKALDEGCTHVVVVPTQPWGYKKTRPGRLSGLYNSWRIRKLGNGYKQHFARRYDSYNEALRLAEFGSEKFHTLVLAPRTKQDIVGNLESNPKRVREAFEASTELNYQRISEARKTLTSIPPSTEGDIG